MNEQLQQAVADLINKSVATAERAGDFIISELPDVVEQLLMYEFWYSFLVFIFGVIIFPLAITGIVSGAKTCCLIKEDDDTRIPWSITKIVLSILFTFVGLFALLGEHDWFKIWIAPKVWLIEYAANLVK